VRHDPLDPTTAPEAPSNGAGAVRVTRLVLVFAPDVASETGTVLGDAPVVIGRQPEGATTLRVADKELSRSHARVTPLGEARFALEDLGSRNGTYVDGVRTARAELAHGSIVRMGRSLVVMVDTTFPAGARLESESPALRGQSTAMHLLRGEIALVAQRSIPVLLLGESGVGKERVARELHARSGRAGAFVALNCAAIPEALAESELFGHVAGAFTGAITTQEGAFVAAQGGTLFLDEVGELPATVQAKLLRALGESEVRALGRREARRVDVRVIAATHREIAGAGGFRRDLFARLAGWTIDVPPLRERKEDVLRLARAFLTRVEGAPPLSAGAGEALLLHSWPLNVRELESVVTAAAIRAEKDAAIRLQHLPAAIAAPLAGRRPAVVTSSSEAPVELVVARDASPGEAELRLVLERFAGNVSQVASFFGRDRRQVYRWAEALGIDLETYRS
jgi:DNA-binding NtrC family response regulator